MIENVDKFVRSINAYNKHKKDLLELPKSVDPLKDDMLQYYADQIIKHGKAIFNPVDAVEGDNKQVKEDISKAKQVKKKVVKKSKKAA